MEPVINKARSTVDCVYERGARAYVIAFFHVPLNDTPRNYIINFNLPHGGMRSASDSEYNAKISALMLRSLLARRRVLRESSIQSNFNSATRR